jgi:hypothetical protein
VLNRSFIAQLTAVRVPLCSRVASTPALSLPTALKIFFFNANTNTMASHEFGRAFGINNDVKPLQSLPITVQRRKDKLPKTPISRAMPESTETPYTSDDTYNNEPDTPTMTRKQQAQSQPPQAPMPSLINTLIAQNQRAEESSRRAEESNRQMMQALMHTIKRLAQSQP